MPLKGWITYFSLAVKFQSVVTACKNFHKQYLPGYGVRFAKIPEKKVHKSISGNFRSCRNLVSPFWDILGINTIL